MQSNPQDSNCALRGAPDHRARAAVNGDAPGGAMTRWRPVVERELPAFRRGALAVTVDPPRIWRHGRLLRLSPSETALLSLVIRRGRATHAEVGATLGKAGARAASLNVLLHRIRRKFAAADAPNPVATVRNWGLMCRVEPDIHGSTALWIGDTIPAAHAGRE